MADVLNDLEKTESGRLRLPNLVIGLPIEAVVQLDLPPRAAATEVCRFRFAWDQPGAEGRQKLRKTLILPAVDSREWGSMPPNPAVLERVALLRSARLKHRPAATSSAATSAPRWPRCRWPAT